MIKRVSKHLSGSEQGLDETCRILKIILENLTNMEKPLAGFKSIVKHLKVLGISTKIESARLIGGDNGFLTLAHDVENLSEIIASKSVHILGKLSELEGLIDGMLSRVLLEEAQERLQTKEILDKILVDIGSLKAKSGSSEETMLRIKDRFTGMESGVGEIVASLQFHDITRQQMDHVREAVDEWREKLRGIAPDSNEQDSLPILADVCGVGTRQLSNSRDEFVAAVSGAMEHLNEIGGRLRNISEDIEGLMKVTDKGGTTFFSELEASVASIIDSLRDTGKAVEDLSAGIQSVAGTLHTLTAFVDEIEEIGTEIELIALNARIKAAHTGVEGAALGVLAEEVKNLSVHGRNQTVLISKGLQDIGALSVDLNIGTGYTKDTAIQETEEMVREMNHVLRSFEKSDLRVLDSLRQMDNMVASLVAGIEGVEANCTVHDRAAAVIDQCISGLRSVVSGCTNPSAALRTEEHKDYLKSLEHKYTMSKERDIHKGLHKSGNHDGLGENVELF